MNYLQSLKTKDKLFFIGLIVITIIMIAVLAYSNRPAPQTELTQEPQTHELSEETPPQAVQESPFKLSDILEACEVFTLEDARQFDTGAKQTHSNNDSIKVSKLSTCTYLIDAEEVTIVVRTAVDADGRPDLSHYRNMRNATIGSDKGHLVEGLSLEAFWENDSRHLNTAKGSWLVAVQIEQDAPTQKAKDILEMILAKLPAA